MPDVLLVEDSPMQARALMAYFELTDYQIVQTERIADAIDHLGRNSVDAILLDLSLPDSQGLDTFRRIQQAAGRSPIVVLTSTDDEEMALQMLREGAQDYLVKGEVTSVWVRRALQYAIERAAVSPQQQGEAKTAATERRSSVSLESVQGVTVVRVEETELVDEAVIDELGQQLDRLVEESDHSDFVLDFTGVDYLSNSALVQLLGWDQRVRKQGGNVRVCSLGPEVQDQIKVRKLLAKFDLCIDLPTALQAFQR